MSTLIPYLLSYLLLYKYWALFFVMLFGALFVPLPTNSALLAAGAFASQGYFNFPLAVFVATSANVLGDCIDYFLARRYGPRIISRLRIRMPTYIERLEAFMRQFPGPTVFVTRFIGTVEEVVSFLAGFSRVPFGIFLLYGVLGNLVADGGVLYVGYFLGNYWQDFTSLFSIIDWILLAAIFIAILFIAMRYRNHLHHTGKKYKRDYFFSFDSFC